MLKLTYTDLGLRLVRLPDLLEAVIIRHVLLAVRTGQAIHLEPSYAAFLVPLHWNQLADLKAAMADSRGSRGAASRCMSASAETESIAQIGADDVAVTPVDQEWVEINLRGLWLANSLEAQEGIFLAALPDEIEVLVEQAWMLAEVHLTPLR